MVSVLEGPAQWQRIERKPDLRGVAIDFMNRTEQSCQGRRPGFFVKSGKKNFKRCFGIHNCLSGISWITKTESLAGFSPGVSSGKALVVVHFARRRACLAGWLAISQCSEACLTGKLGR